MNDCEPRLMSKPMDHFKDNPPPPLTEDEWDALLRWVELEDSARENFKR